jgi:mannosyltransferase
MSDTLARRLALGLCGLAFVLATATLDARALWGDEAFSVWASKQSAPALIGGLDAQPPLYHLALGLARALWGETVFAVRFLSVICAALLVAVGARLGRQIGGPRAATLAASLLATSPILLYYAQEARMYALSALLAGAAMLVARERLSAAPPAAPAWAGYAALALGALLTHYYTAGVLLINGLATGVAALRRRRLWAWLVTHIAIATLFLAWFLGLQSRYVARSAAGAGRIVPLVEDIASNVGVGVNGLLFGMRALEFTTPVALGLFGLALVGAFRYRRSDALLIISWVVAALGLVALTAGRSGIVGDFNPRYYLFALLPLALAAAGWLGGGVRRAVWLRAVAALPGLAMAGAAAVGLGQLFDLSWQKSRYDALIATIRARAQAGDAVVMVNSDQFALLDYYGPLDLPTWIVGNDALGGDAAQALARFVAGKARVWLVNYGWAMLLGPRSPVEEALAAQGVRIAAEGFQDAALALYDLRVSASEGPFEPRMVRFGDQIALVGLRSRAQRYAPGQAVTLDLVWRAERKPEADYTVFMHLRRADDSAQIAALDSPPQNGAAPTSGWSPGQVITETRAVPIPPDAPAGEYNVIIGLYRYPSFERLTIDDQGLTEYIAARIRVIE